jgi:hypothetical protein
MATAQALPIDTWPGFASYLLRRYERFVSEQEDTWRALSELTDSVLNTKEPPGALASARTLAEAADQFERVGRRLLIAPYERSAHLRPVVRSLDAIQDLDRAVSSHGASSQYIDGNRTAPILRARIDGAMQLLLCRACLSLGQPWGAYLAREAGLDKEAKRTEQKESSRDAAAALQIERTQASQIIEHYHRWTEDALIYIALHRDRQRPREKLLRRHERHLDFWRARQRLVAGVLELEAGIWKAGLSTIRATGAAINELKRESNDLRRQVRVLLKYLEQWTEEPFDPPAADAHILGPEERIESWQSRMLRIVSQALPKRVVVPSPRSELPSFLEQSRPTQPRRLYLRALRYEVLPVVEEQFRSRIAFHLEVAATLVRAAEVVRYALEVSREAPGTLVAEALRNAIGLLKAFDESPKWDWEESEEPLVRALIVCASQVFSLARSGHAGVAMLVARRLRLSVTGTGRESTIRQIQALLIPAAQGLAQRSDSLLVDLGWNEPERALPPPVEARSEIRALTLVGGATERSALYRQLFKFTPVEDPRFLAGREAENDGFRQAYDAWSAGRFAACVLVGARGSGKSSLLSCSIPQIVGEAPLALCEMNERLTTSQDLERSLRLLLDVPPQVGLADGIRRAERQVIILERVERAFLRTIGGFEAMRALIELIHQTASSVFWIIVLNEPSFQLLDAALHAGDFFSHRVNAVGVRTEILERVILQRHYLSGLKLSFPELRRRTPQAALGWRDDPQKAFFGALHRESGGNFRAALELWLASIESAGDGVIQLKEPAAPDYRAFRQELGQADHFALLALEQHGSLALSELAAVLCEPEHMLRTRADRLISMGILEQDSQRPEIRICVQAQHTVEELLRSVNLF